MDELILEVPISKLLSVSSDWMSILNALRVDGIINWYSMSVNDKVTICFNRKHAIHAQTVLEFYETHAAHKGHTKAARPNDKDE
jgi:hypothetical protein